MTSLHVKMGSVYPYRGDAMARTIVTTILTSQRTATCYENEFTCSDGSCIHLGWKCDGDSDCASSSDEKDCDKDTRVCKTEEFECGDDRHICIPKQWVCDNDDDCPNQTDERNCSNCAANQFQCKTGSVTCVSSSDVCDGKRDCSDLSDEQNCITQCQAKEFRCRDSITCIHRDKMCNGVQDCPDLSDEKNCSELQCATIKTEVVFLLIQSELTHERSFIIGKTFAKRVSDRLNVADDEIHVGAYSGQMLVRKTATTGSMIQLENHLSLDGFSDKTDRVITKKSNAVNASTTDDISHVIFTNDSCTDTFVVWILDKMPENLDNATKRLKSIGVLPMVIFIGDEQLSATQKIAPDHARSNLYLIEDLSGVNAAVNRISAKIVFRKSLGHIWRALVRLLSKHS